MGSGGARAGERVRRRARVTGVVQGVGFRYSARRRADGLGVAGWVRNEPDGSVLTLVEGAAEDVAAYLAWVRQGPPGAVVRDVVVAAEPPAGEVTFEIR